MSMQATVTEFVQGADGHVTIQEAADAAVTSYEKAKVYLNRAAARGAITKVRDGVFTAFAVDDAVEDLPPGPEEAELDASLPIVVEGVIAQEGIPSGDGRMLERGSVSWDGVLPAPLLWDKAEGDHTAMVVGSVTEVERRGDDIWARALLSQSQDPDVQMAVTRVQELFDEGAVGVSIMLDDDVHELRVKKELVEVEDEEVMPMEPALAEVDIEVEDDEGDDPSEDVEMADDERVVVAKYAANDALDVTTSGRLRHVAVVDTAALLTAPEKRMALAIAASGALVDTKWSAFNHYFDDPKFGDPSSDERLKYDPATGRWSCPPTVNGTRVFGHVAPEGYCLRGRPDRCVTPPDGDVETFMRAYAPAAGGKRTGVICVGGGHASVGIGAAEATRFYDNTGRAVADVRVGKDQYGIWFAGMLRPGASDADVYAFKASDVSGHWEADQNGRMRMCGLPAVNVGGFPKGLYTYAEVMQGIAAAGDIEDCEDETTAPAEISFASIDARLERIERALAPLYAAHLGSLFND